jgi:hypothetical protein
MTVTPIQKELPHTFAVRAAMLHCTDDPGLSGDQRGIEWIDDAMIVVRGAHIDAVAPASALLPALGADACY